jgi:predicted nucleic acid-binding protein
VLIAMLAESHEHHVPSRELVGNASDIRIAIAAHSYAEAYATLTRRGERAPFQFSAEEAWAALESVRAVTVLLGLTAAQTFEAIRGYAKGSGIGARLYDRLIGEVAIANGVSAIVTWNIGHMQGLFPAIRVCTPKEFVNQSRS